MPSWIILAAIAAVAVVAYGVARARIASQKQAGRDAERADRAQADLAVAKKQGSIIAEQRTKNDAADRLDSGDF